MTHNYCHHIGVKEAVKDLTIYLINRVAIGFHRRLLAVVLMGWATSAVAVDVRETDRLVQQWLDLSHQQTALETEWQRQQPLLEQRLTLLAAEQLQLQNILAQSEVGQGTVEAQRATLLAEQTLMEAHQVDMQLQLRTLGARLESIAVLLPAPLQAVWQQEQNALGLEPETSVQLQVALAQLSALIDFDQRISVQEMPILVGEGQQVVVKQMYLGVAGAWFSSGDGSYAGTGYATSEGWRWRREPALDSSAVMDAIAMFEKHKPAAFVQLPMRLGSARATISLDHDAPLDPTGAQQ